MPSQGEAHAQKSCVLIHVNVNICCFLSKNLSVNVYILLPSKNPRLIKSHHSHQNKYYFQPCKAPKLLFCYLLSLSDVFSKKRFKLTHIPVSFGHLFYTIYMCDRHRAGNLMNMPAQINIISENLSFYHNYSRFRANFPFFGRPVYGAFR